MNEPLPTHSLSASTATSTRKTHPAEWELAARCGFARPHWQQLEARAENLNTDPFDLAIGDGVVTERDFLAALATIIDASFTTDPPPPRGAPRAEEAMALQFYTADVHGCPDLRVMAPGGALAGHLMREHEAGKLSPVLLTLRQALLDRLIEADAQRIADRAAHALPERHSARHPATPPPVRRGLATLLTLAVLACLIMLGVFFPLHAIVVPPLLVAPIFMVAGLATLTATFESASPGPPTPPVETRQLPRYSILVPLYLEGNVVEALVHRLAALVYPRDRLEAFLLVEAGDHATLSALRSAKLEPWMRIFQVPDGAPKTKPRALNAALPFCTGDLTVVFDAEDAPDEDQLLRAAALFRALPGDVACLQGRLAISNAHDSFLTRRFAMDYAALFDCIKAGMGRSGWPVPLGGSSNHFRTGVLRQIGGWDAWNVTEDADLGLRLARLGWRVEDLRSTTWEEAPNTLLPWMNQRTRWLKGWLQTVIVHARAPRQLLSNLGLFRAMIIVCMGVSVLVGAMLYPVFLAAIAIRLANPMPLGGGTALLTLGDSMLVLAIVVATLVETIPAIAALHRRKALWLTPYILLAPLTHLLVSIAAWRAMLELIRRPFHWHKTMHGKARREGGLGPINGDSARSTKPRPTK